VDKAEEAAIRLYGLFDEQADERGVWKGGLIEAARSLGLTQSLYQRAIARLKASASIEVHRFSGFTEVHLLGLKVGGPSDLTGAGRSATINRRIQALERGGTQILEEIRQVNQKLDNIQTILTVRRDNNE
jgi:hypothetical protein